MVSRNGVDVTMHAVSWLIALLLAIASPDTGAKEALVDSSSPKDAARKLFIAISAGDQASIEALLFAEDDAQRELVGAMAGFIVAGKRLGDAAREKFGAAGDPIGRGMLDPADLSKIDQAMVKVTGDAATRDIPGQTRPMSFRRQDGAWRLVVTDFGGAAPENLPRQIALVQLLTEAVESAAVEIEAGKFKTADAAAMAVQQRLSAAMMKSYRPATTRAATRPSQGDGNSGR